MPLEAAALFRQSRERVRFRTAQGDELVQSMKGQVGHARSENNSSSD
jgi:hypothetical protein